MTRIQELATAWARVARRAAIFEYPIRDMQARGWIAKTDVTEELESELCKMGICLTSLDKRLKRLSVEDALSLPRRKYGSR